MSETSFTSLPNSLPAQKRFRRLVFSSLLSFARQKHFADFNDKASIALIRPTQVPSVHFSLINHPLEFQAFQSSKIKFFIASSVAEELR